MWRMFIHVWTWHMVSNHQWIITYWAYFTLYFFLSSFFLLFLSCILFFLCISSPKCLPSPRCHCPLPFLNGKMSPFRSAGRLVLFLLSPLNSNLKLRSARLEPCSAGILLGASGPSWLLSGPPPPQIPRLGAHSEPSLYAVMLLVSRVCVSGMAAHLRLCLHGSVFDWHRMSQCVFSFVVAFSCLLLYFLVDWQVDSGCELIGTFRRMLNYQLNMSTLPVRVVHAKRVALRFSAVNNNNNNNNMHVEDIQAIACAVI